MDIWIYVALIALFAGLVKGISGFGSSLVSIPLLALVFGSDYVKEIVVVMVTFNLVLNTLLLVENKGFHPDSLRRVWIIPVFGVIFTILGIYILVSVEERIISVIAGVLIVVAVLNRAFGLRVRIPDTPWVKAIVGSLSGIGNGIASIDGPPVVFYLTSIQAKPVYFKNVLAAHFLVMGLVAVTFHLIWGSYTLDILWILLVMLGGTILGLLVGMRLGRRLDETWFNRIVLVILIGLAISLLLP
jgi:uncharacterized membrane protein YfcA